MTVEETHSLYLCPSSATTARLDLTHAEDRLRNKRSVVSLADLRLAAKGVLGVSIAGSLALFAGGAVVYLFSSTSLSIMIATQVNSTPQFGLLALPVFIILTLLSASTAPLKSMPETLQRIMQFSSSTHFVSFAQPVLYRGAASMWSGRIAL